MEPSALSNEKYDNGSDWTNIAYRLGCPDPSPDEDCHKWITDRLHELGTENEIRSHIRALLKHEGVVGSEAIVYKALLEIPYEDTAFIRLSYPLLRFMWA